MYIVDGHHRHTVLCVLRGNREPEFNRARDNIPVFDNMRVDGSPLSAVEIMNNRKLLSNTSAKALPCICFVNNLRVVIEYARTFDGCDEGDIIRICNR